MRLFRTVVAEKPVRAVFDYLSDFRSTTEWDPGTVSTLRRQGDGDVGTTYLNTSRFLHRTTQLTYVVEEFVDQQFIRLRGENRTVISIDSMTFQAVGSATEVTYAAEFTFKGLARLTTPLLTRALERLGDQAATGMREALNRL
jgi:hypothetical protein